MIFLIIPETNYILDWRTIINEVKGYIYKDFEIDPMRILFNSIDIKKNEEEYSINRFIYQLHSPKHDILTLKQKHLYKYKSTKKEYNKFIKNLLLDIGLSESIIIINKNLYKEFSKYFDRADIFEFNIECGKKIQYLRTNINLDFNKDRIPKRRTYDIHTIHSIGRKPNS